VSRLRAARESDCAQVFAINFAPEVRALSGTHDVVPYASHEAWFARRLHAPAPIWMIEEGGDVVGVVRIDLRATAGGGLDDQSGKISIALAERARGRGIGRRAIAAACLQWGKQVVAEIDPRNTASRACFVACGFVATGMAENGLGSFTWRPL
jgi:L-amino acid N-acyltransferase YncA